MTYKYRFIRHTMYEKISMSQLNTRRSLADMVQLFKLLAWMMLVCLFLAIIFAIIAIYLYNIPFMIVSITIMIVISIVLEILPEKYWYHSSERIRELSDKKQRYVEYIEEVKKILIEYDINTLEKVEKLKSECESILKARETNFSKTNSKAIDMFIGVPLGALVASVIYANSNVVVVSIVTVISIGLIVLMGIKLIKSISYYSDGCFKDKCLLDALDELNYSDIEFDCNV